jgi:hypothetical protein
MQLAAVCDLVSPHLNDGLYCHSPGLGWPQKWHLTFTTSRDTAEKRLGQKVPLPSSPDTSFALTKPLPGKDIEAGIVTVPGVVG